VTTPLTSDARSSVADLPARVDVVVVGGGMGGLSAAVKLGAAGKKVLLLEAASQLGGKIGTETVDGVWFDTGPSVLTLPEIIDGVLRLAGLKVGHDAAADLRLIAPSPAFRYRFDDGMELDVHVALEDTIASVTRTLGETAGRELREFLRYAQGIWEASKDDFVFGKAPTMLDLARMGMARPLDMLKVDPLSSMKGAIEKRVTSTALRQLLLRYATYNGSDPLTAPATLNCIAHVELSLGGYGVAGGMAALRDVLADACRRVGVTLTTNAPVTRLLEERGRVTGVVVGGRTVLASAVVVNADVAWLREEGLPSAEKALPKPSPLSMSGATMVLKARRRRGAHGRVAHEVLFCADYAAEFDDIFRRRRGPRDPTIYLCAQELAHERSGWPEHEPLFAMVNLPALDHGVVDDGDAVLDAAKARLVHKGLIDPDDQEIWRRSSTGLGARFPGSRGSLYGAASNSRASAFSRAPNALSTRPGLFLASGSAHPGGGVPLCVQSGVLAADAILQT
jgi:1-hydroxycarotenoid 3,4-desaturase